jgi:hypothetical protein
MKASILKRLQRLEHTASGQERVPLVLIDVTKMPEVDREAYWAGDEDVLRRNGAPNPADCLPGLVHTLVIDSHPECRADRDAPEDVYEGDASIKASQ